MTQSIAGLYRVIRNLLGRRVPRALTGRRAARGKLDEGITRAIREYREVFERLEKYDRS